MTSDTVSGILTAVADEVARSRDTLNRLDAAAGDGDLGVTMFAAAAAVKQVASEPQVDLASLLRACGMQIAKVAPSTCGTLVATGFLAAARAPDEPSGPPLKRLARLLAAAEAGIEQRGKAKPGDRTVLDALAPAVEALTGAASEGLDLEAALQRAAEAARAGAERTAEMEPRAGRARWLGERSRGHPDAGAVLVALVFEFAYRYLGLTADRQAGWHQPGGPPPGAGSLGPRPKDHIEPASKGRGTRISTIQLRDVQAHVGADRASLIRPLADCSTKENKQKGEQR
jgi:dihydroxyacetone kinase